MNYPLTVTYKKQSRPDSLFFFHVYNENDYEQKLEALKKIGLTEVITSLDELRKHWK